MADKYFKRKHNKENKEGALGSRLIWRLLLLLCLCGLLSYGFRYYLNIRLLTYQENAASSMDQVEETLSSSDDMIETSTVFASPGEQYRKELQRLTEEEEKLRQRQSGASLRDQEQKITDLWEIELSRISDAVLDSLKDNKKEEFREEQKQFQRERKLESNKLLNSGNSSVTENIDYLRKYGELTEARCYEILEKYLENGE